MDVPTYVSPDEVRRACETLGIRDWSALTGGPVERDEAEVIQREIGAEAAAISAEEFRQGLEVELEHGRRFPDANVTNNHPVLTGMIVLAHLKEMLDYYDRLEVAELEGDMRTALADDDPDRLARVYARLIPARARLAAREQATAIG